MPRPLTARAYRPEDYPLILAWAEARGHSLCPEVLSPNGFIVEDHAGPCAVVWVYLVLGVPIAMLDHFFTRPGLGSRVVPIWRKLFRIACDFLGRLRDHEGRPLGYRIVRTYCAEKLAPLAAAHGWQVSHRQSHQIIYALH